MMHKHVGSWIVRLRRISRRLIFRQRDIRLHAERRICLRRDMSSALTGIIDEA